jgi:hypothetical protein
VTRIFTFAIFLLCAAAGYSQVVIKGMILSSEDGLGLPGATIVELGTQNRTTTDLEGNFILAITDTYAVLEISFIGFITKQVKLKGADSVSITLKIDCNRDFFDSRKIGFYALSGVLHNPFGGQLDFAFPYFSRGALISGFAYQTNLKENSFINGKVEYQHFVFDCNFDLDANWYFRRIKFSDFESTTNSFETNFNYRNFRLIAGYSNLSFDDRRSDAVGNFSAPLIGVGVWINDSQVNTLITGKVTLYNSRTEIIGQVICYTKYVDLFVKYYELASFSELTIGIGKEFGY